MSRAALPVQLLLSALGAPPAWRRVELTRSTLTVRLGWLFTLTVPRSSIVSAAEDHGPVTGIGAHGWNGRWLVNTSTRGLLRIELDPVGHGLVIGVPIGVRVLRVGLADPTSFLASLGHGTTTG